MSDDTGNGGNRTVFRPSPLAGMKKAPEAPGAAPAAPASGGASPWGAPPPPPATPASGWASAPASPPPARPDLGQGQGQGGGFGAFGAPPIAPAAPPAHDPLSASRPIAPASMRSARLNDDDIPVPVRAPNQRSPLVTEAGPVLAMAASVRSGRARIAMTDFHREASERIAAYDAAIAQLYPEEVRLRARYALCCTVDDIAQNLPNVGQDGAEWARRSLVVQFFRENIGGERFWQLVDELLRSPNNHAELVELCADCLAAGFEGKYRVQPDGRSQLSRIMASLYGALDHPRAQSSIEISPRWQGGDAPLQKVGLWNRVLLAAAVALAVLLAIFIFLRLLLMSAGGEAWDAARNLSPEQKLGLSRMGTPPPEPAASTQLVRLREFLAPEIRQNLVVVEEDGSSVRIRTTVGQLFQSGSDQLEQGRQELFERIGRAVETEPGQVTVEGHSDSDKIAGTLAFPDNMALSRARAQVVANILTTALSNPGRISVEGYGDSRGIADNATPEGKALNRRVEVVIPRQQ